MSGCTKSELHVHGSSAQEKDQSDAAMSKASSCSVLSSVNMNLTIIAPLYNRGKHAIEMIQHVSETSLMNPDIHIHFIISDFHSTDINLEEETKTCKADVTILRNELPFRIGYGSS